MNTDYDKETKDVGRPEASGQMETPTGTKKIEGFREQDNEKELNKKDGDKNKQPGLENNSDENSGDNATVEESDDESDHN